MSTPILATKLYIPPTRPNLVVRARLLEQLNAGFGRKLTLISAPAGFGKTTLVSEWIASGAGRVAWLSLDEGDNDPTRFLVYLVAALQTLMPKLGDSVLALLQSPQLSQEPSGRAAILTALLNEITPFPDNFTLVLDDYHVLDAKPIDDALTFLLEHMPPQMHLVITTREDPALPLARYRVRGQLTEVRAADLRFTADEAATFLNQVMGLDLAATDVAALENRTEGWIAGLQMTALSLQGRADTTSFIRAFTGSHHFIIDYLVEEVLQRQPERVRNFLLQTAILDRLSDPLCVAVTGLEDGSGMLETLERGNLFVVPLDDQRQWYRYHHLFAEVLQARLLREQSHQVSILHQRASAWYAQNDLLADAVRHALAAADSARAADLIELAVPAMHRNRQEATVLGWMKALPEALFYARPVLSVEYVGAIMSNGEIKGVEARLQDAERWLELIADMQARPVAMVVVNEEEFRRLPGTIAMYRAGQALALGNLSDTVTHAKRVFDLVPEEDHRGRGAALALLGLAAWTNGDLAAAFQPFADGMAHLQMAGNISDAVGGVLALADIRIAQGRLHAAMRIYEQALQLALENGTPTLRGTADMYVGMSELYCERNDLPAAMQYLLKSQEQGEHTGFPQHPYRWRVAMARIQAAQGDLDGALNLLHAAEPLYVSDFFPNVHPVAALKTRVWVAQGRLGEALAWVRQQGLSVADELSYLREFEHITLARVLLAQYQRDHADHSLLETIGLLTRLLQAAEAGERTGSVIEILILQARAHQMQDDMPAALVSLERALTLAEPERYVRMFVDEGAPMAQLLHAAAARGIMPAYTSNLLAALGDAQPRNPHQSPLPTVRAAQSLIEPLSQRELAVLRLFKTELSGPEIARELVIALSTVRTHTKSIYSKLNVDNRRAAVKRATEFGLL